MHATSLILLSSVDTSAANGHGGVKLNWTNYGSDYIYKVFQKGPNSSEYESISTVDFTNTTEKIKVLNIYPNVGNNLKKMGYK